MKIIEWIQTCIIWKRGREKKAKSWGGEYDILYIIPFFFNFLCPFTTKCIIYLFVCLKAKCFLKIPPQPPKRQ